MKVAGYCTNCRLPLSEQERGAPCGRCGILNEANPLSEIALPPVAKQTGHDLFKRDYKKSVKGTKTFSHNPNARRR
jgi:hypothetical protein